jgi:hypothetical protein
MSENSNDYLKDLLNKFKDDAPKRPHVFDHAEKDVSGDVPVYTMSIDHEFVSKEENLGPILMLMLTLLVNSVSNGPDGWAANVMVNMFPEMLKTFQNSGSKGDLQFPLEEEHIDFVKDLIGEHLLRANNESLERSEEDRRLMFNPMNAVITILNFAASIQRAAENGKHIDLTGTNAAKAITKVLKDICEAAGITTVTENGMLIIENAVASGIKKFKEQKDERT